MFLGVGAILQMWMTSSHIQIWLWPGLGSRRVKLTIAESLFCFPFCLVKSQLYASKILQAWLLEVRTKRSKQSGLNEKNNWLYDDWEKVSFNSTQFSSDHTIADFNFRPSQIIQWSPMVLFDPAVSLIQFFIEFRQDVLRGMRDFGWVQDRLFSSLSVSHYSLF